MLSVTRRSTPGLWRGATWILLTLAISAAFGRVAVHNLANFRPVSNDEVELMEVGYQLSTRGVLGSDMYAGFFGAEHHHLWTLPVQHVLDAAVFKVFGASVLAARGLSVAAAIVLIWTVGWLAYRRYGLLAAVVAELLLTAWPSDLIAAQTSLPLLGVARAARYDVVAVAFSWIAIALVGGSRLSRWRAVLAGLCAGVAALTQFYGIAILAVVILWTRQRIGWSSLGSAIALVPYAAYVALYREDFARQLIVYGTRGTVGFDTVLTEPQRYSHLTLNASTILLVVSLAALVLVAWRGERLLGATAVAFGSLLVALDSTKTPLYAIAVLPTLCLALAACTSMLKRNLARIAFAAVVVLPIVGESRDAFQLDSAEASQVSDYLAVGAQIDATLTPGATILGPERWWWALHAHPYRSLRAIWFRSLSAPEYQLDQLLLSTGATELVVNNNVRDDIRAFPPELQSQFWNFLTTRTTLVAVIDDRTYFDTAVYRVNPETASAPGTASFDAVFCAAAADCVPGLRPSARDG